VKPPSVLFRRRDAQFVMSSESRDISHYHLLKIRDFLDYARNDKKAVTEMKLHCGGGFAGLGQTQEAFKMPSGTAATTVAFAER